MCLIKKKSHEFRFTGLATQPTGPFCPTNHIGKLSFSQIRSQKGTTCLEEFLATNINIFFIINILVQCEVK